MISLLENGEESRRENEKKEGTGQEHKVLVYSRKMVVTQYQVMIGIHKKVT